MKVTEVCNMLNNLPSSQNVIREIKQGREECGIGSTNRGGNKCKQIFSLTT